MKGLNYPVTIRDIDRFEKQNPKIIVNVYGYYEIKERIYPLKITEDEKTNHIDLLFIKTKKKRTTPS